MRIFLQAVGCSVMLIAMLACTSTGNVKQAQPAVVPAITLQTSDTALTSLYTYVNAARRNLPDNLPDTCPSYVRPAWSPINADDAAQTLRQLRQFELQTQAPDCERHAGYGEVLRWMQVNIGGIQPQSADSVSIAPRPLGDIRRVSSALTAANGLIKTQWQVNGQRMIVNVELPPGKNAVLVLPTSEPESIRVGGQTLEASGLVPATDKAARAVKKNDDSTLFRLQGAADGARYGFSFPLIVE